MTGTGFERLGIRALAAAIGSREVSALDVTRYFLARAGRFDQELMGYNHLATDAAQASAKALDVRIAADEPVGPLAGIPLSVKDVVDVEGLPATGASASRRGRIAASDAAVVRRLKAAGAVILGKANCHELSFGGPSFDLPYPPARNPWNTDCFPGGSSSGGGVTVASGLCLGSVGTDTAGSVRLPATLCGVVGLKPGFGVLPLDGVAPLAATMDHVGPIAASVDDCRILFAAMRGHADLPSHALLDSLSGTRIGIPKDQWGLGPLLHDDVRTAWRNAIDAAAGDGAGIVELDLGDIDMFHAAGSIVMMAEVAASFAEAVRGEFDSYGEMFRGRTLLGEAIREGDEQAARHMRKRLAGSLSTALETVDGLLIPGVLAPAAALGGVDKYYFLKDPIPNMVACCTGHPALAFPAGLSRAGMPVGMQLLGRMGAEDRLLDIAGRLLMVRPEWAPRPQRYFG